MGKNFRSQILKGCCCSPASSKELLNSGKLGPQHRNENTGNNTAEVFEGQVFMTEEELKPFLVEEANILDCVVSKFKSLT